MDRISLKGKATCGKVEVPPGDYVVTAAPENSSIVLVGGGRNYALAAINRRSVASAKAKKTSVNFYSMGGDQWTIAVTVPRRGEWVAFVKVEKKK